MKIASHIRSRQAKAENQGFTLIELLVVISIIAVLAGLLFPAMGAVRNMARKTSAKNDITQIVNAVKMFYTEYGRYPLPAGSTGNVTFDANNGTLISVLRYSSSAADTLNPRKVRFLEVPNAKDGRSGLEVTGSGATATPSADAQWLDPWRNPYQVFVAGTYQPLGSISVKAYKKNNTTETKAFTVNTEVAAASGGNNESSTADPILSWQ